MSVVTNVVTNTDRLDDEIVINGEVYVRKSQLAEQHLLAEQPLLTEQPLPLALPPVTATAVSSVQEKLARKKQQELTQNSDNDKPDGISMSLQAIKQKLR